MINTKKYKNIINTKNNKYKKIINTNYIYNFDILYIVSLIQFFDGNKCNLIAFKPL